jgi:hypothetical protein
MDFTSLQRSRYRGSTLRGLCLPAPFRLQGLVTLVAVCSPRPVPVLFRTGGALGIHPSERSPPGRHPPVSGRTHPPTVPPAGIPATEAEGRPLRATVSGLRPFQESLVSGRVFRASATGCSLGFPPPRARSRQPWRDFARPPLTRFVRVAVTRRPDRRPRVSSALALSLPGPSACKHGKTGKTALPGFSHRANPVHKGLSGAVAMCSPFAASCIATDRPAIFGPLRNPA